MIVRNEREYFHSRDIFAITIVISETMGGGTDTITRDTVSRCLSRDGGINGGTLSRSLSRWDHYVTECQIQTSHLHPEQRSREQETNQP